MTEKDRDEARPSIRVTDKRIRLDDPADGATEETRGSPEAGVAQAEGRARAPSEEDATGANSEIERERAKASEYLDHLQRLKAEFDNYRKRVLKEQTRAVELATEPLMSRLLEVLDEFELALVAAEQEPKFDKFVRGVEMVYAKLYDILRAEGLERIDAEGKPFDPERHEALLQGDGEGDGEPYVADVLRTGYTLKGRVVRPAGVKVARR